MNSKDLLSWRWCAPPIDRGVIEGVEKRWNIKFPSDYVECAAQHHGGRPSVKSFNFPARREAVFNQLLPYTEGPNPTIVETYEAVSDRLPERVFPFGEDPFGNLLCFDYRNGNVPVVVFWDHESDPERAVSYVCKTFSDLLGLLYKVDD